MRVSYAIVFVSDMKKSVAFCRDVIGLPLRFESPHWTEFATEGATVALHASEGPGPKDDPEKVTAGRCRPGFRVGDLDAFHKRTVEMKVPCIQAPTNVFGSAPGPVSGSDGLGISVGEERRGG